jgi:NADH:ubiquinone oxidoreductase subunit 5 (subunit L)/multisubunit Na+/H+ antiporter MnhA subunit
MASFSSVADTSPGLHLAAALQESRWLYAVGLVASALSAGYAAKIVVTVWRPVPATERSPTQAHHDEEQQGTRHVGALEQAPLVLLAMGALTLGVLAVPPLGDTLARAVGDVPRHTALLELAVSAVIALAVLAWEWRHPRVPEPRWALGWLGLERAAHAGPYARRSGSLRGWLTSTTRCSTGRSPGWRPAP